MMKRKLSIFAFMLFSCSINDDQVTYEEKIVLWANLRSNFPLIDTVFVSKSASLNENIPSKDLWIQDAQVHIIGDTIVDQYAACEALGMSAEAPVVVVRELDHKMLTLLKLLQAQKTFPSFSRKYLGFTFSLEAYQKVLTLQR